MELSQTLPEHGRRLKNREGRPEGKTGTKSSQQITSLPERDSGKDKQIKTRNKYKAKETNKKDNEPHYSHNRARNISFLDSADYAGKTVI